MSETAAEPTALDVPELEPAEPINGTPDADPDDPGRAINPDTGVPYTEAELAEGDDGLQLPAITHDPGRGAAAGGPAMGGGGSSGPRTVVNFSIFGGVKTAFSFLSGNTGARVTTPIVRPRKLATRRGPAQRMRRSR